jgi:hypothetical protein
MDRKEPTFGSGDNRAAEQNTSEPTRKEPRRATPRQPITPDAPPPIPSPEEKTNGPIQVPSPPTMFGPRIPSAIGKTFSPRPDSDTPRQPIRQVDWTKIIKAGTKVIVGLIGFGLLLNAMGISGPSGQIHQPSGQLQHDLLAQCMDRLASYVQGQVRTKVCISKIDFGRDGNETDYSTIGGRAYYYGRILQMTDPGWIWFTFGCRVAGNGAVMLDATDAQWPNYTPPQSCVATY